ncbi:MAG TPA: amidohydrolase family protein [Burkholderiales bacterium]|nr:amidohydrolase family protein [Burkholderiales bacterium]
MAEPSPSFNPNPRKPRLKLPAGATDTHFHVFGPQKRFPFAPERSYTPTCDAPKETLFALHAKMGIARGVVVQSAAHGFDNAAAADLLAANKNYRGVALAPASTSTADLERLHGQGFRGVRFHYMGHLGRGDSIEDVLAMAKRLAEMGWHLQIHTDRMAELGPVLARSPVPVVIDHMGRLDAGKGIEHVDFRALLALLKNKHVWVKVSGSERISRQSAPWKDAAPFARKLVQEAGDRAVWGTDWPHPNLKEVPDDGDLIDLIADMAPSEAERRALLVDNPQRLYGFKA